MKPVFLGKPKDKKYNVPRHVYKEGGWRGTTPI